MHQSSLGSRVAFSAATLSWPGPPRVLCHKKSLIWRFNGRIFLKLFSLGSFYLLVFWMFFFIVYCAFDKCIKTISMFLCKHLRHHSEEALSLYAREFISCLLVTSLNAFITHALVCVDPGLLEFASDWGNVASPIIEPLFQAMTRSFVCLVTVRSQL